MDRKEMSMFNLSKQRLAQQFQQEEMVFKSKPEAEKLKEDATGLAQAMARNGLDNAEDMLSMMSVEYWQYLYEKHPKYLRVVMKEAEKLAKAIAHDFKANPQNYPMPQPQGAEGGGGMGGGAPPGGAMGAADKRTILAFILSDGTVVVSPKGN